MLSALMAIAACKTTEKVGYQHPHGAPSKGKILMVVGSPTISQQTKWPIGFLAAELTHPMHIFEQAGYTVEITSTAGGKIEMDAYSNPTDKSGYSSHDVISLGYLQKKEFQAKLANTLKFTEVKTSDYAAIFLVGGQSPMYTSRETLICRKLLRPFTSRANLPQQSATRRRFCSKPKNRTETCSSKAKPGLVSQTQKRNTPITS
jgi:hypothetical protein